MCRRIGVVVVLGVVGLTAQVVSGADTFEFLAPTIRFSEGDKDKLNQRDVVVRILPATGHELAVLAAGSVNVTPEAFVSRVKDVARLKKSQFVPQIGRF